MIVTNRRECHARDTHAHNTHTHTHTNLVSLLGVNVARHRIYTVSQKNCANLIFVRTLPNFDPL